MRTQLRSMTRLVLMMTAIAGLIVFMSASNSRQMTTPANKLLQVQIFTFSIIFVSLCYMFAYLSLSHQLSFIGLLILDIQRIKH